MMCNNITVFHAIDDYTFALTNNVHLLIDLVGIIENYTSETDMIGSYLFIFKVIHDDDEESDAIESGNSSADEHQGMFLPMWDISVVPPIPSYPIHTSLHIYMCTSIYCISQPCILFVRTHFIRTLRLNLPEK